MFALVMAALTILLLPGSRKLARIKMKLMKGVFLS